MYDDHIEIFSYGNALKNLSREKFLLGVSNPINPELAKICMRLEYVEESGKGINTIVGKYGESVFEFENSYLQVNLPYNTKALSPEKVADKVADKALNKTQLEILRILREKPNTTIAVIMERLLMSDYGVRKNIKWLEANKYVKRVGSRKAGYWEVILKDD